MAGSLRGGAESKKPQKKKKKRSPAKHAEKEDSETGKTYGGG